jgi:hypothetical protein
VLHSAQFQCGIGSPIDAKDGQDHSAGGLIAWIDAFAARFAKLI